MNDPILADLTDAQRRAVTHGQGPLLILAGAGTGKTRVITQRIAHLIAARRARPEEILALTFTDKAAAEMEERVDLLVPYGYADVWISTFHAFGDRVLREQCLHLGLRPDFRVLSQAEQLVFLRDHLFALPLRRLRPLGDPTKHLEALQTLFSRAKDEAVTPEEYLDYARRALREAEGAGDGATGRRGDAATQGRGDAASLAEAEKQVELAECYDACARLMAEKGLLDFGDQVVLTLKLFREHADVLRRYQERFRYVLVDEFQDTNYAQWALVGLLAEARRNITVVGDDDQSIYKFRGAAAGNLQAFLEAYPEAARVVLTENYRSSQPILDAAYRLIQHNNPERLEVQAGVDKRLVARSAARTPKSSLPPSPLGPPPAHRVFDTLSAEADFVAARIEDRVAAGEWRYRDVAILVRNNRDADPFMRALNMKAIPWRFSGNQGLYAREEVRLLISFLRTLVDPEDGASHFHLAASDLYRMPPKDLAALGAQARRRRRSLPWMLAHLEEPPAVEVSAEGRAAAARLLKDLERYRRVSLDRPTGEVLYLFLSESGWLKRLLGAASPSAETEAQNLGRFFGLLQDASSLLRLDRVAEFVPHLDALREAGDDPAAAEAEADDDAVQVLTVHKAKGLEFPAVFLVNLVADRFPSRSRREPLPLPDALAKDPAPASDPHLAEERRLFYVGMTRAKRELLLTAARDHGGSRPRKLSRFILEALDLAKDEVRPYRASATEALLRHAPPPQVEEAQAPLGAAALLRLSYYQVDDYRTCPLKYKYIHILRVPVREHHAIAYGRALHEAISAYLRARVAGSTMTEAEILDAFATAWTNEGFLSREHEELRFAAGQEALRRFMRDETARGDAPAKVEQPFSVRLGGEVVEGRWDRIDERDGRVAIVDYKSSEIGEQKNADKRVRESLQLKLYALAYAQVHDRLPDRVELRFVESGLTGAHAPSAEWAGDGLDAVREAAAGIRAREFTARPAYRACSTCPFRQICPSTAWATS